MDTNPQERAEPSKKGKPLTSIDRVKLGGAVEAALKESIIEVEKDLQAVQNAANGLKDRLTAMRTDLAWINHGVRVGSMIRLIGLKTKGGRVIKVKPSSSPYKNYRPEIVVEWQKKDGSFSLLQSTVWREWEVVEE